MNSNRIKYVDIIPNIVNLSHLLFHFFDAIIICCYCFTLEYIQLLNNKILIFHIEQCSMRTWWFRHGNDAFIFLLSIHHFSSLLFAKDFSVIAHHNSRIIVHSQFRSCLEYLRFDKNVYIIWHLHSAHRIPCIAYQMSWEHFKIISWQFFLHFPAFSLFLLLKIRNSKWEERNWKCVTRTSK